MGTKLHGGGRQVLQEMNGWTPGQGLMTPDISPSMRELRIPGPLLAIIASEEDGTN